MAPDDYEEKDYEIERLGYNSGGGRPPGEEFFFRPPRVPLRTKILFWAMLGGSLIIGTVLFLFFIAVFIYFFLPIVVVLGLLALLRRR